MKLGFDASSLHPSGKGLARLQSELLAAIAEHGLAPGLTVFAPAGAELPAGEGWRRVDVTPGRLLLWEQFGLPRASRGLDVVVTTSERAALWGPDQVVYIGEHPRHRAVLARKTGASARQRAIDALTRVLFQLSLRRAACVLAASAATAADLPVAAQVVHEAVSTRFTPDASTPPVHVLHIASDDPRDNSGTVFTAMTALAALGERPPLVVAGGANRSRETLEALAARLGLTEQVTWTGYVSDDDLVGLYRSAIAYVDPSLYEGFGLQALEALACGTPVIGSNRASLPEVVGAGGILLEPDDAAGIADALHRLLTKPGLREDLRGRALAQASGFSWERTARELIAACAETVARRRR